MLAKALRLIGGVRKKTPRLDVKALLAGVDQPYRQRVLAPAVGVHMTEVAQRHEWFEPKRYQLYVVAKPYLELDTPMPSRACWYGEYDFLYELEADKHVLLAIGYDITSLILEPGQVLSTPMFSLPAPEENNSTSADAPSHDPYGVNCG